MAVYPDAEELLADWLRAVVGTKQVSNELPTNLLGVLKLGPAHVVERVGGSDDILGLDVARVNVDTFALGRAAAKSAAETVRRAIRLHLQGTTVSGVVVSRVGTISAPVQRDYDSREIRLFNALYQLHLHRPL